MHNREQLVTNFYDTELEPVCVWSKGFNSFCIWADMLVLNVVQINVKFYVFGSRIMSIISEILRGQPANSFFINCQEDASRKTDR